ncbi:DUF2892 domain-containing protein [Candidatus Woesearchaeota archaeon]|nr:DUF2892 domain-containing protein [Candidatus Woesearchaeota archaeon]
MKQNLGKLDRIFRFILGVWWLTPLAPQFSMPWANTLVMVVGWIALIESFAAYCWLHDMFAINNKTQ